jgi:hypothetical protein
MTRALLPLLLLTTACGGGGTARFAVDMTTRYSSWAGQEYLAPAAIDLFIEHRADDDYAELIVPSACSGEVNLAPSSPYSGGDEVKDASAPGWWLQAQLDGGSFFSMDPGLYTSPGTDKALPGTYYGDFLGDGYMLKDFGGLSGATSLPMPDVDDVFVDGQPSFKLDEPIQRGDTLDITWEASGVDQQFVLIERMRNEFIAQQVMCPASGDSFDVNGAIWGAMDPLGEDERYRIRVGFEANGDLRSDDGWAVDGVSRVLHAIDPNH